MVEVLGIRREASRQGAAGSHPNIRGVIKV
jgi:hypothetical protein